MEIRASTWALLWKMNVILFVWLSLKVLKYECYLDIAMYMCVPLLWVSQYREALWLYDVFVYASVNNIVDAIWNNVYTCGNESSNMTVECTQGQSDVFQTVRAKLQCKCACFLLVLHLSKQYIK